MSRLAHRTAIRRACSAFLLVALVVAAPSASAGELSLLLKPSYRAYTTTSRDEAGDSTRTAAHELLGRYTAALHTRPYPLLSLRAAATLDERRNLVTLGDGPDPSDTRTTSLAGDARIGDRALNASAGYSRLQRSAFPATGTATSYVSESVTTTGEVRPQALPELRLRLSRTRNFDTDRARRDTTLLAAQLTAQHTVSPLDLQYTVSYAQPTDELRKTESSSVSHLGRVTYGDKLLNGRVRATASYAIATSSTQVRRAGPDGVLTTQRYPIGGLSGVSIFPTMPAEIELSPNPALVDGDLAASANIDLGYRPSLDGDLNVREMGITVAVNSDEPINMIYVWTDRWLPAEIASVFAWNAYTSDDNQRWEPLAITGSASYAAFHNRFEIAVQATTARHVKLVAAPLPTTATTDATFEHVYVTELQVFEALPAAAIEDSTTHATSSLSGSVSSRLHPREDLYHRLSVALRRRHLPREDSSYSVSNTVSYNRVVEQVMLATQLTRQDVGGDEGHRAAWSWSASAATRPLPTLHHGLAYGGQHRDVGAATQTSHQISLTNRATLYRGVSVLANVGYRRTSASDDHWSSARHAAASTSLAPHPKLSLGGTYAYAHTTSGEDGRTEIEQTSSQASASASARPLPSLSVSASITSYQRPGATDYVLASYGGTFSPLPGGLLTFSAAYGESLDFAADGIARRGYVGLRWKIRSGWHADGNYTYLASISQAVETATHVAMATLTGRL